MAANTEPIFALKPITAKCALSAANTARDGSGTLVTLYESVSASGSKVAQIWYKAEDVTTAGIIRLFITDDTGANPDLFDELAVAAVTPSAVVSTAYNSVTYTDLQLKTGQILKATTHNAEVFNVFASIGDFE